MNFKCVILVEILADVVRPLSLHSVEVEYLLAYLAAGGIVYIHESA